MELYFGLLFLVTIIAYVLPDLRIVWRSQHRIGHIGDSKHRENQDLRNGKFAFVVVFIILSVFSVIRDGIGSDYDSYLWHIGKIQAGQPHYMEVGFQKLVVWLAKINDNPRIPIIVLGVFTCYFYLKSIWKQSTNIVLSLFIFLSWGYYFLTFTTVRNYFALSVALFSLEFLHRKKYILFIVLIVFASLFHKSALVCIPVYLLSTRRITIKGYFLCGGLTLMFLFLKTPIRSFMFSIYPQYEGGAYDTGTMSYLNVLKAVAVLALCYIYKKSQSDEITRTLTNLNVFSLVFYVGMYWTPEASRIGFYMNATSIFLIPRVLSTITDRRTRVILNIIIVLFSLVLFYMLCKGFEGDSIRMLPYKTWIFDGTF